MLRVFLSSTFRDLKGERRQLIDNLNLALTDVGMENFIPDGRTSHEISIEELRKSDIVIFLISPYYGSLIPECKIKDCKADCPLKTRSGSISYTHCEYKIALSENKPHQTYVVDADWDIIKELKDKREIDWKEAFADPVFKKYQKHEIEHYHTVADLASSFRDEAEKEMGQRITGIDRITSDLTTNIVKWYKEKKIDLKDFCGRRATLEELIEKIEESVEVYGVGGVGKTSLIQVALLLQKLKGKTIISIGATQSYLTGSGYRHFKIKCAEGIYEVVGNKVTLEDVAIALGIQENILDKNGPEKLNTILESIGRRNIALFIDDFHLSDEDTKSLVSHAHCSIILASKRKIGLARNEIPLLGIEEEERYDFINQSAKRFHKELDSFAKEKIKNIAEGHPVSTEILVRNYERINFRSLENFKKGLNISNPKHSEELLVREIGEILSGEALLMLKRIAIINGELINNINADVIKNIQGEKSSRIMYELLDTGMLSKKEGWLEAYIFSYKHIQDIVKEDKKDHHRWAMKYYQNKPNCDLSGEDQIELLFHQSKIKPNEELASAYLDLCQRIKPSQQGFKRLIDVGDQLRSSFTKQKPIRAALLVSIANIYKILYKYNEARKALGEALTEYRHLYRQDRFAFKPSLASTLNNMANLYANLKKFEDAEKAYQEALKIRRELAEKNPDAFRPDLARTLNNIANLYRDLKKFEDAEKAYQEALKIGRELAEKNPDAFGPDVATTLNNIAILYSDLKKFEDAEKAYQEALKIRRELVKRNPDAFGPNVATTLNNIAILYSDLKKFEDAEKAYQEALGIIRELVKRNPDAFGSDLAEILNGFADLYVKTERFQEAEKYYDEALGIIRELVKRNPDVFGSGLAETLNGFADLYVKTERFQEAEKFYDEALGIRRELVKRNPDAFRSDLAETLNGFADLYRRMGRFEVAEKYYQEESKITTGRIKKRE